MSDLGRKTRYFFPESLTDKFQMAVEHWVLKRVPNKKGFRRRVTMWLPPIDSSDHKQQTLYTSCAHMMRRSVGK